MPTPSSHLLLPIELPSTYAANRGPAVQALDELFLTCARSLELDGKQYAVNVFDTATIAKEKLAKEGDQWKEFPVHDFQSAESVIWVGITSVSDVTRPAMLLNETFMSADFMSVLLERFNAPEHAFLQAGLDKAFAREHGQAPTLTHLLRDLALFDVKDDIASELRHLPGSETVDLSDRGGYIKDAWGVDPVAAITSDDPYAVINAVQEANTDYIGDAEHQVKLEAMKNFDAAQEDLAPVLEVLGVSEDDARNDLDEWMNQITAYKGVLDLEVAGEVAIAAIPLIDSGRNKSTISIQFDGITSSFMNAMVDEDYLAMLELLHVDLRGWVDYMLEKSELPKANWDADVAGIVDRFRAEARYDPETGYHWETEALRNEVRAALQQALFPAPDGYRPPYVTGTGNDQVLNKSPTDATWDYVWDIALEALRAKAEQLDEAWLKANGVDTDKLGQIMSSSEAFATFPQLKTAPGYASALANLNTGNSVSYDWLLPPDQKPSQPALVTYDGLRELLDNCNYDSTLVFAFDCDLDDLQKIAEALQKKEPMEVSSRSAYVHLHNYGVGAGHGIEMSSRWAFSTSDLAEGRMRLDNDTQDRYGIQGVFGEFLAKGSGISISKVEPPLPPLPAGPQRGVEPALGG